MMLWSWIGHKKGIYLFYPRVVQSVGLHHHHHDRKLRTRAFFCRRRRQSKTAVEATGATSTTTHTQSTVPQVRSCCLDQWTEFRDTRRTAAAAVVASIQITFFLLLSYSRFSTLKKATPEKGTSTSVVVARAQKLEHLLRMTMGVDPLRHTQKMGEPQYTPIHVCVWLVPIMSKGIMGGEQRFGEQITNLG